MDCRALQRGGLLSAKSDSSAALPASGSQFLWAAKLMHPIAGAFVSFSTLLMPTMVSLFGVLFGMYLQPLFPNTEINGTVAAVALLVVFAVVAWFGNKTTINTGNVMVVLLLIAIALYIFLGLPHIDTANVTFGQIVRPGVSISTLAAAVGVLTSSLSGASSVAQVADDVKNPGKTVPLALVLCPTIVAVIYILMAVVTIGVIPAAEVTSLSDVAAQFMSPALLTFFIVGGPICGIITSLIPVALACVALVETSAKNKVFPEVLAKQNKYGVAYWSLFIVMGIAIAINLASFSSPPGLDTLAAAVLGSVVGVNTGKAVLVVELALLRVRKHLVCLVDLLELFLGFLVAGVIVRVVLHGQLAVSLFDLRVGSRLGYTQHFVVITFLLCHNPITSRISSNLPYIAAHCRFQYRQPQADLYKPDRPANGSPSGGAGIAKRWRREYYAACRFCPFFCSLRRTTSRQIRCTEAVRTQLMG